jgi:hypothetical protein
VRWYREHSFRTRGTSVYTSYTAMSSHFPLQCSCFFTCWSQFQRFFNSALLPKNYGPLLCCCSSTFSRTVELNAQAMQAILRSLHLLLFIFGGVQWRGHTPKCGRPVSSCLWSGSTNNKKERLEPCAFFSDERPIQTCKQKNILAKNKPHFATLLHSTQHAMELPSVLINIFKTKSRSQLWVKDWVPIWEMHRACAQPPRLLLLFLEFIMEINSL